MSRDEIREAAAQSGKERRMDIPPAMRVFISSTFADMEEERQYFATVLVPELTRMCAARGVSFFSVDLRWGITEEDQLSGNVLPICLREVDKCRPFFIGMIGRRYGSVVKNVTDREAEAFPWLKDMVGRSVTELEMYYGVLRNASAADALFLFRADELSYELYPVEEDDQSREMLARLRGEISGNEDIPSAEYDSMESFRESVLAAVSAWLDREFPSRDSARVSRRRWYENELLRDHIPVPDMQDFLARYMEETGQPLLLYGRGQRGKSTAVTAFAVPGRRIQINCGADEEYQYWPAIAREIISKVTEEDESAGFPDFDAPASLYFRIMDAAAHRGGSAHGSGSAQGSSVQGSSAQGGGSGESDEGGPMYFVTDTERESFRRGFTAWLKTLSPAEPLYIIINDLNLLDEEAGLLNWLPERTDKNVYLIGTTNDDRVRANAGTLGWNTVEVPAFSQTMSKTFLEGYMHIFGKDMTADQKKNLLSAPFASFPGSLKFIVKFLNTCGRFDNLDEMTSRIGAMRDVSELYRYAFDTLTEEMSPSDREACETVFYLLSVTSCALKEEEVYEITSQLAALDTLVWSGIRMVLEQFSVIGSDRFVIRDRELRALADTFPVDRKRIHREMGGFFLFHMDEERARTPEDIRRNTEYARAAVLHYGEAREWDILAGVLKNRYVLYYLTKLSWKTVRSAWMKLLMESEVDVKAHLLDLFQRLLADEGGIEGARMRIAALLLDLEYSDAARSSFSAIGRAERSDLRGVNGEGLSDEIAGKYNYFCDLKEERQFRRLIREMKTLPALLSGELSPAEGCCLYFLLLDAQIMAGDWEGALLTSDLYYRSAIASMHMYDILRAVSMRGEVLYKLGRYEEAEGYFSYSAHLAWQEGALREYLSVLNMNAMCLYRREEYKASASLFDTCIHTWERVGDLKEAGVCRVNRSNALYLSGDISAALEEVRTVSEAMKALEGTAFRRVEMLAVGNMGTFALALGRKNEAEEAFLRGIRLSHELEVDAGNIYEGLISLYEEQGLLTKAVGICEEYTQYLYKNQSYEALASAVQKMLDLLRRNHQGEEAGRAQREWEQIFARIPGCEGLLALRTERKNEDPHSKERLLRELQVARSLRDDRRCGTILLDLAGMAPSEEACGLYTEAAEAFDACGEGAQASEARYRAIACLMRDGDKDGRFAQLLGALSEADRGAALLWRRLKREDLPDSVFEDSLGRLLASGAHPDLVGVCLAGEAEAIVRRAGERGLLLAAGYLTEHPHEEAREALIAAAVSDVMADLAFLQKQYKGDEAERCLAANEKKAAFLERLGDPDAAAVAGNLATIFRRRRDREKTVFYHKKAARLFEAAHKMRDVYIEKMNLATAYKEFGDPASAAELLKGALTEQRLEEFRDLKAAMAGNLAAVLMELDDPASYGEIRECFGLEEAFYRAAGEERELVISLINQLQFLLRTGAEVPGKLSAMYAEAEEIASRNHLDEFAGILEHLGKRVGPADPGKPAGPKPPAGGSLLEELQRLLGKK